MIFANIPDEQEKDDLNESERQSYFSSRLDGESSQTINSEMMQAYQYAIRNAGGKLPAELQLMDQHISATDQELQSMMLKQDKSPSKVPALNFNKIEELEMQ